MTIEPQSDHDRSFYPLVRYLYDCLAAQTEWARNVNVLTQRDVFLVPLTRNQQGELGAKGSVALSSPEAIELGNRFATAGIDTSLRLGALFLVGTLPPSAEKPERQFCAPLLEIPLGLKRDLSRGQIIVEPEDQEFAVNFSLASEILRTNREDLQDRLADLSELVPDFPVDPSEFRDFWNGFRMIATGLPLADELPQRRSGNQEPQPRIGNVDEPKPLELVDFYIPRIPKDGLFRLLPAMAINLTKRTEHLFSALRELHGMNRQPIGSTAFGSVFTLESVGSDTPRASSQFEPADGPSERTATIDETYETQPTRGIEQSTTAPVPASRIPSEVVLELHNAHPLPLTVTQQAVVRSARFAPLTVVTGPPGTGKSYTITAIVLDAILGGRSVLVASQMDKAVEVVARHVTAVAGEFAIARSGGRAAQRALAKKIGRLTGPKTRVQDTTRPSKEERQKSAKRHGELLERLTKLEQRYQATVEWERVWSESHDAYQRLAPICPLSVHEISPKAYRRARYSARHAREMPSDETIRIRLQVPKASLRTYVRARHAAKRARALLAEKTGLFPHWRATQWMRRAVRLFGATPPQALTLEDVDQALRHWWSQWHKRRALDSLHVPESSDCSLDELDEAIVVQGYLMAKREAEHELRAPFAADLLWQEIENVERQRTAEALKLLRLNREATLYALTHSKCVGCQGSGRSECDDCSGSGRVPRTCRSCKGSGSRQGPCRVCGGTGKAFLYFLGTCPACHGSGKTDACSKCDGTGTLSETRQCPTCRGRGVRRCSTCKGKGRGTSRKQLRLFGTLLRRRDRKLKRELRRKIDLSVPLRAFPGWASTNRALGQILPATPGLFDLVVIDEASQCDLATAAVALLRGKRAVIVGDPNQLRHVSFLSRAREQASFAKHGLETDLQERFRYRRSLFDVAADAASQDHFFMLDQHFRSDPQIIDFSNRKFYEGQLRIMTERPRSEPHSAIHCVHVAGRRSDGSSVNRQEVDAVLAQVAAAIERGQPNDRVPTIGIVSPFRDHVDAIRDRLIRQFPTTDIERHEIVVGTAHSLQGDEKDIVVFTTSIDTQCHSASLRFLENPNLFNVAVTRARRQLVVVTSVTTNDLPAGLLREFLQHAQQTPQADGTTEQFDNEFEKLVVAELRKQRLELWPNYRSAGIRIDAVASTEGRHVAILCDGPRGGPHDSIDPLTCHRLLARAGWEVRRISRRSWLADWYDCYRHIRSTFKACS